MSSYKQASPRYEANDYPLYFVKVFYDNFLQEARMMHRATQGLAPRSGLQKGLDFFGAFGKKQSNEIKLNMGGMGFKLKGSPFEGVGKAFQAINKNISQEKRLQAQNISNALGTREKIQQRIANQVADAIAIKFSQQLLAMQIAEQKKFAAALVQFIKSKAKNHGFPENDEENRAEHILDAIFHSEEGYKLLKQYKLPAEHPSQSLSPKPSFNTNSKAKEYTTDFFKASTRQLIPQLQPALKPLLNTNLSLRRF